MSRRRASTKKSKAWQRERGQRLHRKFLSVEKAIAAGKTFKQATKMFVWFWRGKGYRCDRSRQARFSLGSLRHLFRQWRLNGRTPLALRLKYRGLVPSVPVKLLERFVDFSAALQFRHMKDAWQAFIKRGGRFGPGRGSNQPATVTYGQLQYFFTGKKFARLQSAQRAIKRAEKHKANLRWQYTAEIRERLPARPRRVRRTAATVSLDSSAL